MFIDELSVTVKAGRGGNGKVSFARNRKPNGGDGGHGGDVYLLGSTDVYDFRHMQQREEFVAGDGADGGPEKSQGALGKELVIKVPLETVVRDQSGEEVLRISKKGQKELLLKGGAGGMGNYYFRKGQLKTLRKATKGKPGKKGIFLFDLLIKADVVLLGWPNAGKSSLLNALSNAKVKVADYPFTTLDPNLGISGDLVILDLPGLIEGAAQGKGLGKKFMKHVAQSGVLAFVISLENDDLLTAYKLLLQELEEINPELPALPRIVILTKTDLLEAAEIKSQLSRLKKTTGVPVTSVSVLDDNQVAQLKNFLTEIKQT